MKAMRSWWQKIKSLLAVVWRRWLSLWQQIKKHSYATGVIVVLLVLIAFSIGVISFGWGWTGFTGGESKVTTTMTTRGANTANPGTTVATETQPAKTLWDWLGLLAVIAIPIVVGFGAAWFTIQQGKVADAENKDNQREIALQDYIDTMSELLLHEKLRESAEDGEVRKIARVRTLTILPRLDRVRKRSVLQLLYESGLIEKDKPFINLDGADLSRADLSEADLSRADLGEAAAPRRAAFVLKDGLPRYTFVEAKYHRKYWRDLISLGETDLSEVDLSEITSSGVALSGANLREADLSGANLGGADLRGTFLYRANLGGADLRGANLGGASLRESSLQGADLREADLSGANLNRADLGGYYEPREDLGGVPLIADVPTNYHANLRGTNLYRANLRDAKVSTIELDTAKSLEGAIMPDGSIHP